MNSLSYILKEMAIGAVSCLLVVSIVGTAYAPMGHNVRHAEAIPVFDASNFIQSIITAIQTTWTAIKAAYLQYKESWLDFIVWRLINVVIQRMIRDVTNWVRSGFQGEPAFLGNPDQFLTGIADQVVGDFLASTELGQFICSPFRLEVRGVLDFMYKQTRNTAPVCTFSGALANVTNFFDNTVNGGFLSAGGWDSWYKVTQNPQNNPYGSVLMAQERVSLRLVNAKGNSYGKVSNAQGFLAKEECREIPPPPGPRYPGAPTPKPQKVCQVTTPGSTIEKSLNENLNLGGKRIAVADEVNELVGAFLDQVVTAAFNTGISPGRGGGAVPANYTGVGSGLAANAAPPAENPIAESLTTEIAFRSAVQPIVTSINAAESYKSTTYPPLPVMVQEFDTFGNPVQDCIGVGIDAICTPRMVQSRDANGNLLFTPNPCHSGQITPALVTERNNFVIPANASADTIATLTSLNARYQEAQAAGDAEAVQEILNEYGRLASSNVLHTTPQVQGIQQVDIPRVNEAIAAFKQQVDAACYVPPADPCGGGCGA